MFLDEHEKELRILYTLLVLLLLKWVALLKCEQVAHLLCLHVVGFMSCVEITIGCIRGWLIVDEDILQFWLI